MKLRSSHTKIFFSWRNFLWIGSLHVLAIAFAWSTFSWTAFAVFLLLYYVSGLGITLGFHRYFTHSSFMLPSWAENILALFGTLACQGGPISWVAAHRLHHMYSDTDKDPHSAQRGFFYAHCGWLLWRRKDLDDFVDYRHYAKGLSDNKYFIWLEKNMILVQVLLGVTIFFIGGYAHQWKGFSWYHGFCWVVWGVFVRIIALYHATWFVNSACHTWGKNANHLSDRSKNLWWVALLAFGEGWHNNHHAQAMQARHGVKWWQIDQTWYILLLLKSLKIATGIVASELTDTIQVEKAATINEPGLRELTSI